MTAKLKLAILISGNGSNLQAIVDAIESGWLNADIKAVISNNHAAFGLVRATRHGLHTWVMDRYDYENREQFDKLLQLYLEAVDPDFIVLAGFMRILGSDFVAAFEDRILNIHPSLLPAYKGLDTYRRALDNNESEHGVSVHLVNAKLDDGPVIMQASYPIEPGDNAEDLKEKGVKLEHRMYPQVLKMLADKQLTIKGGQVFHDEALLDTPLVYSP